MRTCVTCSMLTRTMLVRIQPGDPTPLFQQIAAQVRRALGDGQLQPGERLPAARQLAESLEVNMHTVLRAYDELRSEGLVEVRRGRGVVVTGHAGGRARLIALARQLMQEAKKQGLNLAELTQMLGDVK